MTMKLLDNSQHVARLGDKQKIAFDEHGKVLFITHHFFELRPNETYVSCNWMEFFPAPEKNQIKEISKALSGKNLKKNKFSRLVQLSVGSLHRCGADRGYEVKVHHRGKIIDPSYSGISGLPEHNKDQELLSAMGRAAFIDVFEYDP